MSAFEFRMYANAVESWWYVDGLLDRFLYERLYALGAASELLNARSNATLQATIDDLRGAIDVLRASNRLHEE